MTNTLSAELAALFEWANRESKRCPELKLMYAIPKENAKHAAGSIMLKKYGIKRNSPDIFFPVARGKYHGLFIDLTRPDGKLSFKQIGWLIALEKQGYATSFCDKWEKARDIIVRYLSLTDAFCAYKASDMQLEPQRQ